MMLAYLDETFWTDGWFIVGLVIQGDDLIKIGAAWTRGSWIYRVVMVGSAM